MKHSARVPVIFFLATCTILNFDNPAFAEEQMDVTPLTSDSLDKSAKALSRAEFSSRWVIVHEKDIPTLQDRLTRSSFLDDRVMRRICDTRPGCLKPSQLWLSNGIDALAAHDLETKGYVAVRIPAHLRRP